MKGEIVSFQLLDVGGDLDLAGLATALGASVRRPPAVGKGTPAYVEFPQPLIVDAGPIDLDGPAGTFHASATLSYYGIGVICLRLRVPFQDVPLERLSAWTRSTARLPEDALTLEALARRLVEQRRATWAPFVRDPYPTSMLHEAYTVFALHDVEGGAQTFLARRGPEAAGLLKGEPGDRLHEKEVREALRSWFSYYHDDVVVIEWDAALVIDPDADYEDLLFVLEIANLQLLEFRVFDAYLDALTGRAYDELAAWFRRPRISRGLRRTVHELSLIRIEVGELADKADNITKFLGDWFLARVYQAAQQRFHIPAWRAAVDEKLGTINRLYRLATDEGDARRMLVLEALIVLLFVVDLLALFFGFRA